MYFALIPIWIKPQ